MIIVPVDVMGVAMISVHSAMNQRYEDFHGPSTLDCPGATHNSFSRQMKIIKSVSPIPMSSM